MLDFLAVPITDAWKCLALPNCTVSRSIVVTQQLQRKWYRRQRADGDQRPADRSPLLTAQLFRKQQRDAGAQHCTRARDETDLRNGDFVLFHLWFESLNRNANPPQMGSGRKPSAAASGSRGAVSFSSARTAKRFPSRCASSDVVKDEQSGLSIHTLRNCLDPRHRFY